MAEENTQKFVIYIYAWNKSVGTWLSPDSKTISFDEQNVITKFEYSQGKVTFYDANDNVVGDYIFDNQYKYEEEGVYLPLYDVNWDNIFINENLDENGTYTDNVPLWGGQFDVYYGSESETGDPIPETTLTLSPSNLSLYVGETGSITATTNSQQSITWSSNNEEIATVDDSGLVTAISTGSTRITASVENISESCTVTVSTLSYYTLKIYNESKTDIIETITIPKDELINKHIYDTGVYKEINNKDGYYISEWKNLDTGDTIPDRQTMEGNLDIYPIYTKIDTDYYSIVYLPNLTQRFPFGAADNSALGDTGGNSTITLKKENIPYHTHSITTIPDVNLEYSSGAGANDADGSKFITGTTYTTDLMEGQDSSRTTSSFDITPPYLTINFIIKYE